MKGRGSRAALQFACTACVVTTVHVAGQDSKHAPYEHKSETFPLPDPFHTSYCIERDQNKIHYTTFKVDPLSKLVEIGRGVLKMKTRERI